MTKKRKAGVFVYKLSDMVKKRLLIGGVGLAITAIVGIGAFSIAGNEKEESPKQFVDLNDGAGEGKGDIGLAEGPGKVEQGGTSEHTEVALGVDENGGATEVGKTEVDKTETGNTEQEAGSDPGQVAQGGEDTRTASGGDTSGETEEPTTQVAQTETGSQTASAGKTDDQSGKPPVADTTPDQTAGKEDEGTAQVLSPQVIAESLTYQKEKGLIWPLMGNLIIPYSPEHGVYHYTLEQFRTSDAIVLSSEIGTPVAAAAKGVVTSITDDVRTGKTLELALGNNTKLVYGQLELNGIQVGDVVEEGEILGSIAKPTRYYVVEGPNLYFKVMEAEESINPMLLLHAPEDAPEK